MFLNSKYPLKNEDGQRIQTKPGTNLLAVEDQRGVDGAMLLSGSKNNEKIWIVILSQSKWDLLSSCGQDARKMSKSAIRNNILSIDKVADDIVTSWLGKIEEKRNIYVFYDFFSDRPFGPKLTRSDFEIPKSSRCAGAMFTTEESFIGTVGPMLGIRARLKPINKN
jgi:hypothetical protein